MEAELRAVEPSVDGDEVILVEGPGAEQCDLEDGNVEAGCDVAENEVVADVGVNMSVGPIAGTNDMGGRGAVEVETEAMDVAVMATMVDEDVMHANDNDNNEIYHNEHLN